MSDSDNTGAAASGPAPTFTERELQMLGWAMQSLKSGPPEIDYEKLAAFAGMGNPRSASNAWAKIRGKLQMSSDSAPAKATPKKKAGAAKKEDGEEGTDTPKKTPRKRAAKKETVDGENASPKKKGRPVAKGKKASDDESADGKIEVKAEVKSDDSDTQVNGDAPASNEQVKDEDS